MDFSDYQLLRVLLIDNDPLHLDRWSLLLAYAGYEVRCARNCSEAAARLGGIHCVLLDHDLPDMSGIDFIRYMSATGSPAFILFTSEPVTILHLAALQAGAALTLTKPAALHEVVNAIEQACWRVPHALPKYRPENLAA